MASNPSLLAIIFWGIVTFSLLVVIHEGGHFFAARAFGVRVHEFMIGLPGPALRYRSKRSGIAYGVTAIPLGGYVRIAGMEPGAEDELLGPALKATAVAGAMDSGTLADTLRIPRDRASSLLRTLEDWGSVQHRAGDEGDVYRPLVTSAEDVDPAQLLAGERRHVYAGLKTWQRITVLSMGVLMNLLTAILLLTVTLSIVGYPQPSLTLAGVAKASPAAAAGLTAGDSLVAIDDRKLADWPALLAAVASRKPGDSATVSYLRAGTPRTVTVVLASHKQGRLPFLGVISKETQYRPSPFKAAGLSLQWTGLVFVAIAQFFNPATFATSIQGARSVVGISVETARAASSGVADYVYIVALLSLSLGVMNLLPLPPLDGGKIVLELVEKVMRRPIPKAVSLGFSLAGALLLFSLIGYLMYSDVIRYVIAGTG
jgi:regulator of sigma E protease